ncbi:MAG TPA: SCP2 sterol-binding domain-containing protein [Candidatus Limnocylindria bacterium]|nr:SCP2 sterol-binding domain-containing protein [Candidatus Limnocylindria bacterium]
MTPDDIFARMAAGIDEAAAKGLTGTVQFNLAGEGGGAWYVTVKDGTVTVSKGTVPSPNMTMAMDAQDFVDMNTGKLNPQVAFMTGKLKISGDMSLAMKMQTLFKPIA